ncbi:MAG: ABC transporter ATP-binding protein [Planctomycetes bacterium]|nr:ABC transporter ATP-binding protein [Planctomycetota bacterium]
MTDASTAPATPPQAGAAQVATAPAPTPATAPAVETAGLTHRYGERVALAALDLAVQCGEIFGLLGPNGGGKTTLFRVLSTLMAPTGGTARVLGLDVGKDARAIRSRIGVVFQTPSLDKKLKVIENLRYAGHLYGLAGADLDRRIQELLERFRLADRASDLVEKLSGGLQRRVDLARGLLHGPELVLMDEPTTGLDPGARIDLWEHLRALRAGGKMTLLVTTHLMEDAEKCDRLGILDQGKLVGLGAPEALKGQIGGDVITVGTAAPEQLRDRIRERFGGEPAVVDGKVRIERPGGARFIPELLEAFSGEISTVMLGKPTLEDVFTHLTGHRFRTEDEAA